MVFILQTCTFCVSSFGSIRWQKVLQWSIPTKLISYEHESIEKDTVAHLHPLNLFWLPCIHWYRAYKTTGIQTLADKATNIMLPDMNAETSMYARARKTYEVCKTVGWNVHHLLHGALISDAPQRRPLRVHAIAVSTSFVLQIWIFEQFLEDFLGQSLIHRHSWLESLQFKSSAWLLHIRIFPSLPTSCCLTVCAEISVSGDVTITQLYPPLFRQAHQNTLRKQKPWINSWTILTLWWSRTVLEAVKRPDSEWGTKERNFHGRGKLKGLADFSSSECNLGCLLF